MIRIITGLLLTTTEGMNSAVAATTVSASESTGIGACKCIGSH